MSRLKTVPMVLCTSFLLSLAACRSTLPPTEFTNPKFDFSFVERIAVLPFENLSNDRQAGFRATRLMVTELLASGAVDVVEPGEVQAALRALPGAQFGRIAVPDTEQIVSLGQQLGVQALILGTVTQSENLRAGTVPIPVVTLDVHLVETATGAAVWASTHSERGASMGAKILGTGGQPIAETTRVCVQRILASLIE